MYITVLSFFGLVHIFVIVLSCCCYYCPCYYYCSGSCCSCSCKCVNIHLPLHKIAVDNKMESIQK